MQTTSNALSNTKKIKHTWISQWAARCNPKLNQKSPPTSPSCSRLCLSQAFHQTVASRGSTGHNTQTYGSMSWRSPNGERIRASARGNERTRFRGSTGIGWCGLVMGRIAWNSSWVRRNESRGSGSKGGRGGHWRRGGRRSARRRGAGRTRTHGPGRKRGRHRGRQRPWRGPDRDGCWRWIGRSRRTVSLGTRWWAIVEVSSSKSEGDHRQIWGFEGEPWREMRGILRLWRRVGELE